MKQVRVDERSSPPPPSDTAIAHIMDPARTTDTTRTTTTTTTTPTTSTRRRHGVPSPPLTLRDSIQLQGRYFGTGVWDSLQAWPHSLLVLYSSGTIRSLAFRCLLLNGVIFLGSLALFHGTIGPVLQWWASVLLGIAAGTSGRPSTISLGDQATTTVPPPPPPTSWTELMLRLCYQLLWVWPVYMLSFLLNSIWYQEIADRCYHLRVVVMIGDDPRVSSSAAGITSSAASPSSAASSGTPSTGTGTATPVKRPYPGFVRILSDEIYRNLLSTNFLLLTTVSYFVPVLGRPLSFIGGCWLYSLYSFEYVWINKGWSLEKRLQYFEERWSYFMGFGFSCALVTFWFPQFIGGGIFALLFPMYIIMSNAARPQPVDTTVVTMHPFVPSTLPLFYPAKKMNLFTMRWMEAIAQRSVAAAGTSEVKRSQ